MLFGTVHAQLTVPKLSAFLAARPESEAATLLYRTLILQFEVGLVFMLIMALSPGEIGDVTVCTAALSWTFLSSVLGTICFAFGSVETGTFAMDAGCWPLYQV